MSDHTMQTVDPRGEILAQIALANDETQRNFLILLLGILDQQKAQYMELNKKLDTIIGDEKAMRTAVLNGHAETHHEDHDYVKELRSFKSTRKVIDQWAVLRMQAEKEAAEQTKTLRQKFAEAVIAQAGTLVAALLAGLMGAGYLLK